MEIERFALDSQQFPIKIVSEETNLLAIRPKLKYIPTFCIVSFELFTRYLNGDTEWIVND